MFKFYSWHGNGLSMVLGVFCAPWEACSLCSIWWTYKEVDCPLLILVLYLYSLSNTPFSTQSPHKADSVVHLCSDTCHFVNKAVLHQQFCSRQVKVRRTHLSIEWGSEVCLFNTSVNLTLNPCLSGGTYTLVCNPPPCVCVIEWYGGNKNHIQRSCHHRIEEVESWK